MGFVLVRSSKKKLPEDMFVFQTGKRVEQDFFFFVNQVQTKTQVANSIQLFSW